jgi:hypothetical protein
MGRDAQSLCNWILTFRRETPMLSFTKVKKPAKNIPYGLLS